MIGGLFSGVGAIHGSPRPVTVIIPINEMHWKTMVTMLETIKNLDLSLIRTHGAKRLEITPDSVCNGSFLP